MSTSRVLLLQTLIDKGASCGQVDLFRGRFGDRVEVTRELALEVAPLFSLEWAARELLSRAAWVEYDRGTRVMASAGAKYRCAAALAFADAYINDEAPA